MSNPGCACNHPIYKRVIEVASKQLAAFYPTREAPDPEELSKKLDQLSKNNWEVINCTVNELQEKLRELGPGRKQLDIARFQDQVTVVVNHLEGIY